MTDSPLALVGANKKSKKATERPLEITINLDKPTRSYFPCYDFQEEKRKAKYDDGLSDPEDERFHDPEAMRIYKLLQEKYASKRDKKGKKRNIGCVDDYIDKAAGYDLDDDFIDDSEAYDTLVPSTMEPMKKGFYVNRERLEFRFVEGAEESDSDDDEPQPEQKKRKLKPVEETPASSQPSTSAVALAAPVVRLSNGAPPSRMSGQPPSKKAAIQSSAGPAKKPVPPAAPPAKVNGTAETEKEAESGDTAVEEPQKPQNGQPSTPSEPASSPAPKSATASPNPYTEELLRRIRAFQSSVHPGKARQRLTVDQVKLIQRVDDQMLSDEMRPHAKSKVMDQLADYAGLSKVTLTKLLQKHKESMQDGSPSPTEPGSDSPVSSKTECPNTAKADPQVMQMNNLLLESLKTNPGAQNLLKALMKSKVPSTAPVQKPAASSSSAHPNPKPGPSTSTPQAKSGSSTPPVPVLQSNKPPVLTPQKPQLKPAPGPSTSKPASSANKLDQVKRFKDFKLRFDVLRNKEKSWAPGVAVGRGVDLLCSVINVNKRDGTICVENAFRKLENYNLLMETVENTMNASQKPKNAAAESAKQSSNGSTSKGSPLTAIKAENVQNTMHNSPKPMKKPSTSSMPPKLTRMEPETITIDDGEDVQASTSKTTAKPPQTPPPKTPKTPSLQSPQQQAQQNLFQMAAMGFLGLNLNNKDVMSQISALQKATTSPGPSTNNAQTQLSVHNQILAQMIQSGSKLTEDKLLAQIREEQKRKAEEERKRKAEEKRKKEQEELLRVMEKKRKHEEELQRQREEEERKRKEKEELARRQKQLEEEQRRKEAEERERRRQEELRKLEEQRRVEEMRRRQEEERKRLALEEHRRKMEEEHRRHQQQMMEEQRRQQEEFRRRQEEEQMRIRQEEEKRRAAAAAEEMRRRQEELRKRLALEEHRRKMEEQQKEQLRLRQQQEEQRRLQQQQEEQRRIQQHLQQQQHQKELHERQQRAWQEQQILAQQRQQQMMQMQQRLQQQQQQQQQPTTFQQQQQMLQMQQMMAQQQTSQAQQQQPPQHPQQQQQFPNQSQYYHQNLQNGHNWPGN